jgi:hypothetical protein
MYYEGVLSIYRGVSQWRVGFCAVKMTFGGEREFVRPLEEMSE